MSGLVAPLVPGAGTHSDTGRAPVRRGARPAGRRVAPLPLVAVIAPRTSATVYGSSIVDSHGRVGGPALRALEWDPGARVNVVATRTRITVTASAEGALAVTPQGHVRLPASARHVAGIEAGVCVVLAADPASGTLRIYPPATLDTLLPDASDTATSTNPGTDSTTGEMSTR